MGEESLGWVDVDGSDRMVAQDSHQWKVFQITLSLGVVLGLLEQDFICARFTYGRTQATQRPWVIAILERRIFWVAEGLLI